MVGVLERAKEAVRIREFFAHFHLSSAKEKRNEKRKNLLTTSSPSYRSQSFRGPHRGIVHSRDDAGDGRNVRAPGRGEQKVLLVICVTSFFDDDVTI